MRKVIQVQLNAIKEAGFTVDRIECGRHHKAYISLNGAKHVMPMSGSPSGGRWLDNFTGKLRRLAREAISHP